VCRGVESSSFSLPGLGPDRALTLSVQLRGPRAGEALEALVRDSFQELLSDLVDGALVRSTPGPAALVPVVQPAAALAAPEPAAADAAEPAAEATALLFGTSPSGAAAWLDEPLPVEVQALAHRLAGPTSLAWLHCTAALTPLERVTRAWRLGQADRTTCLELDSGRRARVLPSQSELESEVYVCLRGALRAPFWTTSHVTLSSQVRWIERRGHPFRRGVVFRGLPSYEELEAYLFGAGFASLPKRI